jgi:hypothetical protein
MCVCTSERENESEGDAFDAEGKYSYKQVFFIGKMFLNDFMFFEV